MSHYSLVLKKSVGEKKRRVKKRKMPTYLSIQKLKKKIQHKSRNNFLRPYGHCQVYYWRGMLDHVLHTMPFTSCNICSTGSALPFPWIAS